MIATFALALLGTATCYWAYQLVTGLTRNIAAAKRTGLPYLVIPACPFNPYWQATHQVWLPLIKLFPRSWWEPWLEVTLPNWTWHLQLKPFNRLGENFIVVSPGQMLMFTCSPEVIRQITARKDQFPKPLEQYGLLNLFGRNVVTTEGALWRYHRKLTAAGFNERNTALIFTESVKQTQTMVDQWLGSDGNGNKTIKTAAQDTMTLALNIIGYVGFGLQLIWPGQAWPTNMDAKMKKYASSEAPAGHTLSFAASLATVLEKIVLLLIFPPWMLALLPFKATKAVLEARTNYVQYMNELMQDKVAEIESAPEGKDGMDIMGQLVRSKYGAETDGARATNVKVAPTLTLSDSEIIGNAFIMILAGHETTANSIHFTLLELAMNPSVQRQAQADIDAIYGRDSDPTAWDYDRTINALMGSMIGACMNETLRFLPPVCEIPKMVTPEHEEVLVIDGNKHVMSPGMIVSLVTVVAHRNPRAWPTKPSKLTEGENDLDDYVPERWYRSSEGTSGGAKDDAPQRRPDEEELDTFKGPDTSAALFRPPRGAYIPFSDGPRSCLGRRIAQVEVLAALAAIMQRYSVELAVDEWASDEQLAIMDVNEKSTVYEMAASNARETIRLASSIITLKLPSDKFVPIRLVKRGDEKFVDWIDA